MYIVAFSIAYALYRKQVRERRFPLSEDNLSMLFFWAILGLLLGARIFSTLIYEPFATNDFIRQPWRIFWPFRDGRFTGFQGMSYHGGVIGCLLGAILWSKKEKYDVREIGDMFSAAIPLGYTFGRIGNFINAELYGRVTAGPLGIIFPLSEYDTVNRFSPKLDWVREIAEKAGIALPSGAGELVNLPRHPSQLYEAFFEGIVLWAIVWFFRNRKPFKGFLMGLYAFCYGFFRFFIEYFREPDADLGYRIQLGTPVAMNDIAHLHPPLSFSTGQLLCLLMMLLAVIWWIFAARLPNAKPIRVYAESGETEPPAEKKPSRNARRNLRKKLR